MNTLKKYKILFILPSLEGGGAERVTVALLNHFPKELFDLHLALIQLKQYKDQLEEILPAPDGKTPNALSLTKKDFLLWDLILAIDPSIHGFFDSAPPKGYEESTESIERIIARKTRVSDNNQPNN